MDRKEILKAKIKWERIPENIRYCSAEYNGSLLLLRINNFPDEPLFTLINGKEITDFDDLPSKWDYPYLAEG